MLRSFSALPTENRVRALTDRDILWCAVNLMLDEEQELEQLCPSCRSRAQEERCLCCGAPMVGGEGAVNPLFDLNRFSVLKRGEHGE